jgi:hypothetical protein
MAYKGGKSADGIYHQIINQIPPHKVYIEPFLGHGGILRHKRPAIRSIGLDMDPDVLKWWKTSGEAVPGCIYKNGGAISFLQAYPWKGDEFIYLDPPYLRETRRDKSPAYKFEFWTVDQHTALLDLILTLPCMVAISGYWSDLYNKKLLGAGWREIHFQAGVQGGYAATEYLWMNYPVPFMLHDYRYLGNGYRDREKINRQRRNLLAKFKRMNDLQRYAFFSALDEYREELGNFGKTDRATQKKAR